MHSKKIRACKDKKKNLLLMIFPNPKLEYSLSVSESFNVTKIKPNIMPTATKVINAIVNTVDDFIFDRYPVSVKTASNSSIVPLLSSFRLHSPYSIQRNLLKS